MECGYKFRVYPTNEQETFIKKTFGSVRFVYNHYLGKRRELYRTQNAKFGYRACSGDLTKLKKQHEWLKEPDSIALQASLEHLQDAYDNYFESQRRGDKDWGMPSFKSKKDPYKSYTTKNVNNNIKILDRHIILPKVGKLRCRYSRDVPGRVLNVTVSLTPGGKYFVSICCTDVCFQGLPRTNQYIGIDLGIKEFATSSDGKTYENCKFLHRHEKKIARLQRRLSRKQIGSRNRNKARVRLARMHEYIKNSRNDAHHKLSAKVVRENDIIAFETLKIKNMVKNRKLSKSISDVGWGEFVRQVKYKADRYGKTFVRTDTFFASTQKCSTAGCGYINKGVADLSVREWTCPECGASHERDHNSAINILKEGLRLLAHDAPIGLGRPEFTSAESI